MLTGVTGLSNFLVVSWFEFRALDHVAHVPGLSRCAARYSEFASRTRCANATQSLPLPG